MSRLRTALLVLVIIASGIGPTPGPALGQSNPAPGSLGDLLRLVPLIPLGGDSLAMVYYGNPASQLEALGLAPPENDEDRPASDDWLAGLGLLFIHSRASYMIQPEWEEFFGFNLFDIDQAIELSAPPTSVTVMRGRFDADDLVERWEASGYEERDWATGAFYTIRDDFEIEFASEGSRMAMASANYMAVLGPDLIAFAPSELLMTTVLDLAAGTGQSLADELNIASLLQGVPDDLVSGTLVSGTGLLATGDPDLIFASGTPEPPSLEALATEAAERVAEAAMMPPLTVALLGSTAGGPVTELATSSLSPDEIPAAKAVAVVVTVNDSAAWTVAEVVDTRLRRDDGVLLWSDYFSGWSVHVVEEEPVVRVELELAPDTQPGILLQMFNFRELGFLAWSP